jgi:hypothetical protein
MGIAHNFRWSELVVHSAWIGSRCIDSGHPADTDIRSVSGEGMAQALQRDR